MIFEKDVIDIDIINESFTLNQKNQGSAIYIFSIFFFSNARHKIKEYIKKLGEDVFRENRALSEWYELCLNAVKIMGGDDEQK